MHVSMKIVRRLSEPRPDLDYSTVTDEQLAKLFAEVTLPDPYTALVERQLVAAKRMLATAYGDEAVEIKLVVTCGSFFDSERCDDVRVTYQAERPGMGADGKPQKVFAASPAEAASALLRHYPPAKVAPAAAHGACDEETIDGMRSGPSDEDCDSNGRA
jgi:hypothetical protein